MISNDDRRGATLIELSVVISVSSVLLAVSAGWIHQSMKFGSVVRSRQNLHHRLLRLGSQLREDVQQGEALDLFDESKLVIRMNNKLTATFVLLPERVTRIVSEGEQVISQESYSLDPTGEASWDASGLPTTIALTVRRGSGLSQSVRPKLESIGDTRPIDLHVRTTVGRFAVPAESAP
jgi:prepilin-type N-terminal cleavage/methylation domain-containing protein